jgi:hypothetical protein
MDLNFLLRRHQLSLMASARSLTSRDKRAQEKFALGYADQIRLVRAALGASPASSGAVT